MADQPTPDAPPLASARALGRTVLEIVHTRLELLALEIGQERDRLAEVIFYGALLLLFAFLALVLGGVLVVAVFWDTPHRVAAVAIGVAVPAMAALGCAATLVFKLRSRPRPFDASLLALSADVAVLR